MRFAGIVTGLVGLAAFADTDVARAGKDLDALVQAERAFAKASVTTSMRSAFLACLADDAVMFRPGPVNGKELYIARPESEVVLAWDPSVAEISAAGDMGYTSGPWSFKTDKKSEPSAYGHFVSVWKKQRDGTWKVALDAGVSHSKPAGAPTPDFHEAQKQPPARIDVEAAREALLEADGALAKDAAVRGAEHAIAMHAASTVRIYREGAFPRAHARDDLQARSASSPPASLVALGSGVAESTDLGYTYGSVTPRETGKEAIEPTAYYVRIWRRETDGQWRVVLDLESPVPPRQ